MPESDRWAERIRVVVLDEDRRHRDDGEVRLRAIRVVDDHRLEFDFVPSYLGRQEVTLVVDGRRPFFEDFLIDAPAEEGLAIDSLPIEDVAWRIFLLGMHEPFPASELVVDAQGRSVRSMTA